MNEDLKPCLDIESSWDMVPETNGARIQVFRHKDYNNLFRIIDFKNKSVGFRDTRRVLPENVIDIYRKLTLKEKGEIMGLVLETIHDAKPIQMPYVPESLKMFVEYHKAAVGFLYFKDNDEEQSIVPIKRFFLIKREPHLYFEEINWNQFYDIADDEFIKEEETDVDKNTEQAKNS